LTSRKDVTAALHRAVTFYFVKRMFAVHKEVGVERWGKLRLDLLCTDLVGNFVGVEVKSGLPDFRSDKKWRNYLEHVDMFYFCFGPDLLKSRCFPEIKAELKSAGVGILALSETTGMIRCVMRAKRNRISIVKKHQMYKKLAWRAGDSKRTIKRTQRVYLK